MLGLLKRLYIKICIFFDVEIDVYDLPQGKYIAIERTQQEVFKDSKVYDHYSILKNEKGRFVFVLSQRPLPRKFFIGKNQEIDNSALLT